MSNQPLTAETVRQLLSYDPETGLFAWREVGRGRKTGRAGCLKPNGYVMLKINGIFVYAHRLAWLYVYGKFPEGVVDHRNRNRSDNRISNLRDVTPSENQQNAGKTGSGASPYRGVYLSSGGKRWRAEIEANTRRKHLGYFDTEQAAAAAYERAREQLHIAC